ncbi:hypothetical protein GCM10023310_69060 [Paenibacillus vulneris]|uniref:Uncharacterized protein n=1 Tax=Paenibacillus vulneris TaxID=1133364 RepID=A0ABW3UH44_9BACL
MNQQLIEVDQIEKADLVYIVSDHRKLGFTDDKYYPLYERNGEKFAIDDYGRDNYGIFSLVKTRLYKYSECSNIHSFPLIDNQNLHIEKVMGDSCRTLFHTYETLGIK